MTPDNKIMDYVVGIEKNLLKVKEENEKLKQALREFANDENWMFEITALKEEIKGWMRKASEQEHTIVDWENYVAREKNKNHKLKSNLKIAVDMIVELKTNGDFRYDEVSRADKVISEIKDENEK